MPDKNFTTVVESHRTSRTPAYTSCPPYNMAALPRGRSLKVLGVQVDTVDAKTVDDRWVIAVALGGVRSVRLTHDTHMHGSRRRNCARAATWIRNHPGHRLYLLCELFAVGYSDDVLKALPLLAEPLDGESVTYFQKVPRSLMQLYPPRRSHTVFLSWLAKLAHTYASGLCEAVDPGNGPSFARCVLRGCVGVHTFGLCAASPGPGLTPGCRGSGGRASVLVR